MIKNGQQADANDLILTVLAGEALSARESVYISTADGKAYKTDADDLTKMDFAGFAQETVASGASVTVKTGLIMPGFSSLTINANYYLSGTAGAITTTPPTNVCLVGKARSATVIEIRKLRIRRVVFTASGTWTKYPGLVFAEVEGVGGGGGGGGCDGSGSSPDNAGCGGGGGGYFNKIIQEASLGATETVTVGAGGGGVTNGTGVTGGTTSFGAHCSATGGTGGQIGFGVVGVGGIGTGGDYNIGGTAGGIASSDDHGPVVGTGGSSHLGGGGHAEDDGAGGAGRPYGGGGGGAFRNGNEAGGSGADGIVIVTEYY